MRIFCQPPAQQTTRQKCCTKVFLGILLQIYTKNLDNFGKNALSSFLDFPDFGIRQPFQPRLDLFKCWALIRKLAQSEHVHEAPITSDKKKLKLFSRTGRLFLFFLVCRLLESARIVLQNFAFSTTLKVLFDKIPFGLLIHK